MSFKEMFFQKFLGLSGQDEIIETALPRNENGEIDVEILQSRLKELAEKDGSYAPPIKKAGAIREIKTLVRLALDERLFLKTTEEDLIETLFYGDRKTMIAIGSIVLPFGKSLDMALRRT